MSLIELYHPEEHLVRREQIEYVQRLQLQRNKFPVYFDPTTCEVVMARSVVLVLMLPLLQSVGEKNRRRQNYLYFLAGRTYSVGRLNRTHENQTRCIKRQLDKVKRVSICTGKKTKVPHCWIYNTLFQPGTALVKNNVRSLRKKSSALQLNASLGLITTLRFDHDTRQTHRN